MSDELRNELFQSAVLGLLEDIRNRLDWVLEELREDDFEDEPDGGEDRP